MRVHLWLFWRPRGRRQPQGQPLRERRRGTQPRPRPCDDIGNVASINGWERGTMACRSSDRRRSSANRRFCAGPSVRRTSCTHIMRLKKIPGR
jgi:hypothetical protein